MLLLVLAVVVIGGGAGYYFKIYRPKQEQAAYADQEYDEYEADPYNDQEDDTRRGKQMMKNRTTEGIRTYELYRQSL